MDAALRQDNEVLRLHHLREDGEAIICAESNESTDGSSPRTLSSSGTQSGTIEYTTSLRHCRKREGDAWRHYGTLE